MGKGIRKGEVLGLTWNDIDFENQTLYVNKSRSYLKDDLIPKEEKNKYILPVLSFHKLRHTSATLLVGGNTDIRTITARLGHTRTSMTMDIYAHGLKSSDRKASDTLENLLGVESASPANIKNA